ncbi:hypothetical protein F5B20DRAFT_84801 [Whalleya microplaca]|nr:hypothetical protein F5B20DRAFT_84801 [Whalleya microplaca]
MAGCDSYDSSEQDSKATCLSSENHDCDIKDHLLHYLGCIEICDRERFFEDDNPLWSREIVHLSVLKQNSAKAKTVVEADEQAAKEVLAKRKSWQANCQSELRRIDFLRKILANDSDDMHLVQQIEKSRSGWRDSPNHEERLEDVKKWRAANGKRSSRPKETEIRELREYEPEKDVSVPIIQFENGESVDDDDDRVWNNFPNQKTILSKLLDPSNKGNKKDNLLSKDHEGDRIKYFHIPSNNMIWAERAIGLYFGEGRPNYHATHRQLMKEKKTRTYMILREPYWRSQLHGGQQGSPPHARHLRPLCATISSKPYEIDDNPNNMVLFMPYLHWDTSRKREQFAMEIDNIMSAAKDDIVKREKSEKEKRRTYREPISRKGSIAQETVQSKMQSIAKRIQRLGHTKQEETKVQDDSEETRPAAKPSKSIKRVTTMGTLLKRLRLVKSQLPMDENGRVKVHSPLGQYLIDAARLYEGINNYRDKKLLRKYLPKDPPLHPRRTLDQAYYWTLNSTRKRDRDQVVYRGTTAKSDDYHQFDYETGKWTEHTEFKIKGECTECKLNIQKLSRVIMVDQLWMWILDAKTIITCFPKRYGANKQDPSGVHKSIRVRLQDSGKGQIRSVFDLALIIIDECSNTFFDRTRTVDPQPQVIDTFSTAIGNIMHKQTAAFERLWRWTDQASEIYRSNGSGDTSELHVPLLDINPEGKLEREIKDIIEELDIMIHITKTHREILTTFVANAENILDPHREFGDHDKRATMSYHRGSRVSNKPRDPTATDISQNSSEHGEDGGKREDYIWFKLNADERIDNVKARIEELEELRGSAVSTAESVKDLLDLKQQQASVVQAWQAVKQSEETIKQGRSIMMFTLVTIVFLPLSFMSSVFGMNNIELSSGSWHIRDEFVYMFPISAAVIFISLLLAFSTWIRAGIWYLYKWFMTAFLVGSGLYDVWLDINQPSKRLHRSGLEWAERKKENARRDRFARRRQKRAAKDAATKASGPGPSNISNADLISAYNGNGAATENGSSSGYKFPLFSLSRYRTRDSARNDVERG